MNEIHSGCADPITIHFIFHFKLLEAATYFYWSICICVSILGSVKSTGSRRVSGRQQAHQCGYYKGTQAHHCGLWYLHYLSQHLPGQASSPYQAVWASKTRCPWFLGWGFWPRLQSTYSPLYQLTHSKLQTAEGFVHTHGIRSWEVIWPACSWYIHEEDSNSDSWIDSQEHHKVVTHGQSAVQLNWGLGWSILIFELMHRRMSIQEGNLQSPEYH